MGVILRSICCASFLDQQIAVYELECIHKDTILYKKKLTNVFELWSELSLASILPV